MRPGDEDRDGRLGPFKQAALLLLAPSLVGLVLGVLVSSDPAKARDNASDFRGCFLSCAVLGTLVTGPIALAKLMAALRARRGARGDRSIGAFGRAFLTTMATVLTLGLLGGICSAGSTHQSAWSAFFAISIPTLFATLLIAVVFGVVALEGKSTRRSNEIVTGLSHHERIANRLGMRCPAAEPRGGFMRMTGSIDSLSLVVDVYPNRVELDLPSRFADSVSLKRKRRWGRDSGSVPTGDVEFDRWVTLQGPPEVAAAFGVEARRTIQSLLLRGAGLRIDNGHLRARLDGRKEEMASEVIALGRLLSHPGSGGTGSLAESVTVDRDPAVRLQSLIALIQNRSSDASAACEKALADESEAIRLLAGLGLPEKRLALIQTTPPEVFRRAITASPPQFDLLVADLLGDVGPPAEGHLLSLLADPNNSDGVFRERVIYSLGLCAGPAAVEALKAASTTRQLSEAAALAIQRIQERSGGEAGALSVAPEEGGALSLANEPGALSLARKQKT